MDKSINKIVKYLREVSVVVFGVAITLSASYFITRSSEKRDMRLYLTAIKMELEENIKICDMHAIYYKSGVKYANYLNSDDKAALSMDSIWHYQNAYYGGLGKFIFKNNAFEMFKSSGNMRLLNDKELLLEMWDLYFGLSYIKNNLDELLVMRDADMMKEWEWTDTESQKNIPMYNFYKNKEAPYIMQYLCETGSAGLKEFVVLLDKALKIKKIPENESLMTEKNDSLLIEKNE